jgi:heat shock protein HtpX
MTERKTTNIWVIEKQKTAQIYFVLAFLGLIHFIGIYAVWLVIKLFIWSRTVLFNTRLEFRMFGWDTFWVFLAAAAVTGIHWYLTNRNAVGRILLLLKAQVPDKRDKYHVVFENVVDEIEAAAGGVHAERYILPTGAMNAFALADLAGRRVVGVTEGLISRLDRSELQSVVAHEMAHIISGDCLLITMTTALYGLYEEGVNQLARLDRGPAPDERSRRNLASYLFISVPLFILLFILENLSQLLNLFISREREYRADAAAVRYTREPLSLARALYKIGGRWRGAGLEGDRLANIFILSPDLKPIDERDGFFANLFSTHPPLDKRLAVILKVGHADFSGLIRDRKSAIRTVANATTLPTEPRFFVERSGAWTGPLTVLQLTTVDGLEPETRLKMENTETVMRAADLPGLEYYFKVRDEPVWKIRRLCPICRQWLIVEEYEGLNILRCAFCDGVLIENDKLPRIFARLEKAFGESVRRTALILREEQHRKNRDFKILVKTPHPYFCPRCGKPMVRKFFSYAYHVEVDECRNCGVVWFDRDELEILQCMIEAEEGPQN